LLRRVKDADVKVLLISNKLANRPHQAYVSDVVDEEDTWSTILPEEQLSVSQKVDVDNATAQDDIEPASAVHTTGNALELQELQGQETINNIHSKGPKAGGIVEVRSCSRDHATDAIA
jgi:hypothetical protein